MRRLLIIAFILFAAHPAVATPGQLTTKDLAPISLGRHDAEVRSLIIQKRWLSAAKKIRGTEAGGRLVKGVLLERAGENARALKALKGVAEQLPLLAELVHLTRGRALLGLERYEDAIVEVRGLSVETSTGRKGRRVHARCLRESGALKAAHALYLAMADGPHPAEVPVGLLGLARLAEARGALSEALEVARRIDLEYPAHWVATHARSMAKQINAAKPVLKESIWLKRTLEARVERAERLLKRRRNRAALKALKPLATIELSPDLLCRQRYAYGRVLKNLRRRKEATPVLEAAVVACEAIDHDQAPWARHVAGKLAERLAREEEAAVHYRAQIAHHPDHRLADDAGYFLVRHLVEDVKDLDAAFEEAQRLVEAFPNGDMTPDAVFVVVKEALRQGKKDVAVRALDLDARLPVRDFHHRDGGRTGYWRARLAKDAGRRKEAIAGFEEVIASYPLGWYAILSFSRLKELNRGQARRVAKAALQGVSPGPSLPSGTVSGWHLTLPADVEPVALERAVLLARLGLWQPAREALKEAGGVGERADLLWLSAVVLDRAGAYPYSHNILRRKLTAFRRFAPFKHTLKHWKVAFPNPYLRLVEKNAKATEIDRSFIWGVMREESGFNAKVESHASAVGLMQLILTTAQSMVRKGEASASKAALRIPARNIQLGARYLAYVRDRTRAVTALWPAGYNAGAGALRKWLKQRGHLPLDLFVELIPYEEARGYTKRVVSSWATYRVLYGGTFKDPLPYLSQRTQRPVEAKKKKRTRRLKKKRKRR